jgi:uncharacterized protein
MKKTSAISSFTLLGLLLSFFGPALLVFLFRSLAPEKLTNSFVIVRELSLFIITGLLILLIIKGEKLDLSSIGLHNKHWGKSILWSFLMMIIFIAVVLGCLGLFSLIGISYGQGDGKSDQLSLWIVTLVMVRAGIVEEIFYRGYIMERLYSINGNWLVYFFFPAAIFGILHYNQGIGGVIIAFVGGLVISWFYWKKRDLKANIMAHFMVDFIPNVLIPLIGGE